MTVRSESRSPADTSQRTCIMVTPRYANPNRIMFLCTLFARGLQVSCCGTGNCRAVESQAIPPGGHTLPQHVRAVHRIKRTLLYEAGVRMSVDVVSSFIV